MPGGMRPNVAIFIPGIPNADDAAARALASTAGLSIADARMLLSSRIPRKVATVVTAEEAEDRVLSLRSAGFDAFALAFDALRARPVQARSAQFTVGGVEFQPGGPIGVRLVVQGQILTVQKTKASASARTQGGGLVPAGSATLSSRDAETFVHFYGASPAEAVEIRPRSFNFRCLGAEAGVSKAMGLKNFLDRIRSLFPAARFDDTLLRVAPPSEDVAGAESYSEGAAGGMAVSRKAETNEAGAIRSSLLIATASLPR